MKKNHKKATDKYIEILLETIDKEPQEFGYEFSRWSDQKLATYLGKLTGIQLSGSQVKRILEQKKYVYLWAKYSLEVKKNTEKRKAFKKKILEYLRIEKEAPEQLQLWFWDVSVADARTRATSGFSLRVIRKKNWGKKGNGKKVREDRRKGRVNVMGGLRCSDKKRFVEFLEKGNADNFYKVLKIFYQELINEWVEAGNQAKDFAEKRSKYSTNT